MCLVFGVLIEACTQYQHPELESRQLGWQPDRDLTPFLNTDSVIASLDRIKGTKNRLDSLLEWTDMLKNYDEEAALAYANEAYRLAVEKGYRLSQAIGMYYRALLKGRGQILGEGIEDALADGRISQRLLKSSDDVRWLIKINGLLGQLFYLNFRRDRNYLDTAEFYSSLALQMTVNAAIPEEELHYFEGQIFLDLANTYAVEDSAKSVGYFKKSIDYSEKSGNQILLSKVWQNYGNFFVTYKNYEEGYESLIKSEDYAKDRFNPSVLTYTYQKLADLLNKRFYKTKEERFFKESMHYLNQSQKIQLADFYYTYLLKAYNYHDKSSFQTGYTAELDSAIFYYKLAMEEARKEGTLEVVKNTIKHISNLCSRRDRLTGEDCSKLFEDSPYYLAFINQNYAALVDTMRNELLTANQRIREFESQEQAAANKRRVNRNWLISGVGLLFAGLIFLLLLQQQQKKRLQARMEALRAQINPHFISNSLNAIENLVNMNQREAAAKYLIHFSRLSRKILNSSRSSTTSLAEELQTLKHFLALEQLRFRDKLNYDIEVSSGLDPEQIEVPALILQPYVENAIWHGIKPKSTPSHLHVFVERQGKQLICIVEDDGIGREKAREIKGKSVLQAEHQSQGMKITEERLKAVGQAKGSKVEIIDLHDTQGNATGTRVIVKLPFKIRKTDNSENFNLNQKSRL